MMCPGDALIALGANVSIHIVALLNRMGYERCVQAKDWLAEHVGSRELAEKALEMSVQCEGPPIPSRGFGDTIAKGTKAIGIRPCKGCKKRQALLNKLLPYKGRK